MSDRVAIIGGKTVGWDHLPFPIPELGAVGGFGTAYPFDAGTVPIASLCFAYYNVKRWQIDINISRHVPDGMGGFDDIPIVGTYYANAGELTWTSGAESTDPFERESDLAVPRGMTNSDDATTSNFAMFCDEEEVGGSLGRAIRMVGEFSPLFYFDVDAPNGPATYQSPGTGHGGTMLNFLDESYVLYSSDGGYSGTVDIYGAEFWPYATKAGLPVYDTSTGAQLRDPFS